MSAWMPQKYIASENRIQFHTHTSSGRIHYLPASERFPGLLCPELEKSWGLNLLYCWFSFLFEWWLLCSQSLRRAQTLKRSVLPPQLCPLWSTVESLLPPSPVRDWAGETSCAIQETSPFSYALIGALKSWHQRVIPQECHIPWLTPFCLLRILPVCFTEMPVLTTSPRHVDWEPFVFCSCWMPVTCARGGFCLFLPSPGPFQIPHSFLVNEFHVTFPKNEKWVGTAKYSFGELLPRRRIWHMCLRSLDLHVLGLSGSF